MVILMDLEHLDKIVDNFVIVEMLVEDLKVHEELEEVDEIEEDLKDERVLDFFEMSLKELDAVDEDDLVELVDLEEDVVVDFFDDEEDDFHEVVETEVLVGLGIRFDNELEYLFEEGMVGEFLEALQMSKDLYHFVPNCFSEISLINIQDLLYFCSHLLIYFL